MRFTSPINSLLFIFALGLSSTGLSATPKCLASVSRESRTFKPTDIDSQNLYSRYSYNSFEKDSRSLFHITSDPLHPLYEGSKKAKEALGENTSLKESLSNRLNIEAVMKDFGLSRIQAVELQALLRRYFPKASNEDFLAVVELVRAGKSMSGIRLENMKKAKFVVAIDVDGTLLDQDYQTKFPVNGVHQHVFAYGGKTHSIAMSPGAEALILGIKKRGGSVVIFSRNSDELIQVMFESIKIDGVPIAEIADAIYSSSHMVINPADRKLIHQMRIHEVVTKDLRLAGGSKAIIIDDNPDYVLQKNQTRVVTQFDARSLDPATYIEPELKLGLPRSKSIPMETFDDSFFAKFFSGNTKSEKETKKTSPAVDVKKLADLREAELLEILQEIDSALAISAKKGISFAAAFEKFSVKSYKILEREQEDPSHDLE
jgi:hypothetical protein